MSRYSLLNCIARHDEQRGHLEALELRAQAVGVVEALHVDGLLGAGDDIDRDVVVAAILEHHQRPCTFFRIRSSARLPYAIGTIESIASGSPQRTR